jgi:hypothetical protein
MNASDLPQCVPAVLASATFPTHVAVSCLICDEPGPVSLDGSASCRNGSITLDNFGSSIGLRVFSSRGNAEPWFNSAAPVACSSPLPEDEGA